ncbi:MAG TPA: hypothetical protein EYH06_01980 [Chromatiales bacterium]|nr:hypothetical protein [Thiotrichales bacterium]HIP67343.1 hypothetical protein [Chromatiales bacterium]
MDKVLFFSILLVFAGALVGSVMQHRRLDRVLKDLRGFHVTARIQGKRIWGRFNLFSNAIEFIFSRPYTNRRGNLLTSFIVFSEQMNDIDTIFRFHDELTPKNQQRRLMEIEQIKHPSLFRRIKRSARNFMVAFREAIDESIGLLMSRVQKKASTALLKGQDDYLKKIRTNTLGMVSTAAYDPVLEHYINRRVVYETGKEDGQRIEYSGVLKEYSTGWVSILDCYLNTENHLPLSDASRLMMQRKMDFQLNVSTQENDKDKINFSLQITNRDNKDIAIWRIEGADNFQHEVDEMLTPGDTVNILLKDLPASCLTNIDKEQLPISLSLIAPERQDTGEAGMDDDHEDVRYPALPGLTLVFDTIRGVDVYIPRSKGLLRHGSEFID